MKIGSITHEELVKAIADAARSYGWRVAGFRTVRIQRKDGSVYFETPVRFDGKGWPDMLLFRKPRCLAFEIKVKRDTLKPEQKEWLLFMEDCGIEAYEWHEADWIDGEILRVLT